MKYVLKHGLGPGTIPKGVEVVNIEDHPTNYWKQLATFNRDLTEDELKEFDIIPYTEVQ